MDSNNNNKTAIVIGATGLVGSNLIRLLITDKNYDRIVVFVRRSLDIKDNKIVEHIVDFEKPDEWREKVKGDVLFSALGTTIKKAGSKENQYIIDYEYQYNTAVTAATNGVKNYVLVSATSSNSSSFFFYNRIKGELEDAVITLPFETVTIVRPGLLYGTRPEKRAGEGFALECINFLNAMGIMKRSKAIHGKEVAQAMLYAQSIAKGVTKYTGHTLFMLAAKYGL